MTASGRQLGIDPIYCFYGLSSTAWVLKTWSWWVVCDVDRWQDLFLVGPGGMWAGLQEGLKVGRDCLAISQKYSLGPTACPTRTGVALPHISVPSLFTGMSLLPAASFLSTSLPPVTQGGGSYQGAGTMLFRLSIHQNRGSNKPPLTKHPALCISLQQPRTDCQATVPQKHSFHLCLGIPRKNIRLTQKRKLKP